VIPVTDPFSPLVQQARAGDKSALEALVIRLQDRIYGISLRMLYHPQDAEDAAQEILIKIITRLDSFRGSGAFQAWALKVASNHLLSFRRKRGRASMTFDEMAGFIVSDWPEPWRELEAEPMQELIVEEFRIACLQMVLLGLDRGHRLAYILGAVFDVSGKEGAEILQIRPAAFRKRLQRAKKRVQTFLLTHCALIKPENPCLCARQTDHALHSGRMTHKAFRFVNHPCYVRHDPAVMDNLRELDKLQRISVLFKSHPGLETPAGFVGNLRNLVASERFKLLSQQPAKS
jgi:RNA polymerase sigma factor (sigma-70 family)